MNRSFIICFARFCSYWTRSEHADVVQATKQVIQARNPNAFAKKIAQACHAIVCLLMCCVQEGEQSSHTKGCHCKKTGCLKKYCECFQAGVVCSERCRCVCCKNRADNPDRQASLQVHLPWE